MPGEHSAAVLAPVVSTKEPAGALVQTELAVYAVKEPVLQGVHVAASTAPSNPLDVPMAQSIAALAPVVSTKVPVDAFWQVVLPLSAAK